MKDQVGNSLGVNRLCHHYTTRPLSGKGDHMTISVYLHYQCPPSVCHFQKINLNIQVQVNEPCWWEKQNKTPLYQQEQTDVSITIQADPSVTLTVLGRLKREHRTLPWLLILLHCLAWENAKAIKRATGASKVKRFGENPRYSTLNVMEMAFWESGLLHIESWRSWPSWETRELSQPHLC